MAGKKKMWHKTMQGVRAISFDLDDTLWPTLPTLLRAEAAVYRYLEQHCPEVLTDPGELRAQGAAFFAAHPALAHDLTALRRLWFEHLLGADSPHVAPALEILLRWRSRVVPFADVVPVLRQLRLHYTLISFTNGNAEVQATPLRDRFDFNFRSQELGVRKPETQAFALMLERIGLPAHAVLHVGDNVVDDVQGARDAGLKSAWIQRPLNAGALAPSDSAPEADLTIHTLHDLVHALGEHHG